MKTKTNLMKEASRKCAKLAGQLPLNLSDEEVEAMLCEGTESLCRDVGLVIMERWLEAEVQRRCGKWGKQPALRHGRQHGYVVFGGQKLGIERPRVRSRDLDRDRAGKLPALSADGRQAASRRPAAHAQSFHARLCRSHRRDR